MLSGGSEEDMSEAYLSCTSLTAYRSRVLLPILCVGVNVLFDLGDCIHGKDVAFLEDIKCSSRSE